MTETLSQLINRLRELYNEHGDIRVEVTDGNNDDPIQSVEIDPENNHVALIRIDPEATP